MDISKGDRVMFRGKPAKVMAHPSATLRLHVGQGQIIEGVSREDVQEIAEPEPKAEPKAQSQGTAPRQRSKPVGRSR